MKVEHITAPLTGGPTLRMPLQAAPVSRSRGALDPAADGVQANGLPGFLKDLFTLDVEHIGKDILDWVTGR